MTIAIKQHEKLWELHFKELKKLIKEKDENNKINSISIKKLEEEIKTKDEIIKIPKITSMVKTKNKTIFKLETYFSPMNIVSQLKS